MKGLAALVGGLLLIGVGVTWRLTRPPATPTLTERLDAIEQRLTAVEGLAATAQGEAIRTSDELHEVRVSITSLWAFHGALQMKAEQDRQTARARFNVLVAALPTR